MASNTNGRKETVKDGKTSTLKYYPINWLPHHLTYRCLCCNMLRYVDNFNNQTTTICQICSDAKITVANVPKDDRDSDKKNTVTNVPKDDVDDVCVIIAKE
jgi:hypothetical protein